MKYQRIGFGRNVYYTILRYRTFMPYYKVVSNSSYCILLNYAKKVIINTGVMENQKEVQELLDKAGLKFSDIDIVINMTSRPEHIGLNTVIQFQNPKTQFYTHPAEKDYIVDTAYQYAERYTPFFYRLVAGNTDRVNELKDGDRINLGDETLAVHYHDENSREEGYFSLYLEESRVVISPSEVRPVTRLNVQAGGVIQAAG